MVVKIYFVVPVGNLSFAFEQSLIFAWGYMLAAALYLNMYVLGW